MGILGAVYGEFYCDASVGDNRNAGSTQGAHLVEYTSGSWVASSGVFTVASGNPVSAGVDFDMMASVYTNGAALTGFFGRVVGVTSTTITLDTGSRSAGTLPVDASGTMTLRVGGCWKGPNALEDFPFGVSLGAVGAFGGYFIPRVNFKGTFNITGAITHSPTDTTREMPTVWQGYGTTPGDGVAATIKGTIAGSAYVMLTIGNTSGCRFIHMEDFIFTENGTTGASGALAFSAVYGSMRRVKVHFVRGFGISVAGVGACLSECYVTDANQSLTANVGAFSCSSPGARLVRCVASGNAGVGLDTSNVVNNMQLINCMFNDNGAAGLNIRITGGTTGSGIFVQNCDFYNNATDGIRITGSGGGTMLFVENTNFVDNFQYGVNQTDAIVHTVQFKNCGWGTGNKANNSGNINLPSCFVTEEGSINYPTNETPYRETGSEFSGKLLMRQALNAGWGKFSPLADTPTSYPDIGATSGRGQFTRMGRPHVLLRR